MKKIFVILLALALFLLSFVPVWANGTIEPMTEASTEQNFIYDESLPRVIDNADLLTDSDEKILSDMCMNFIEKYHVDTVFLTVDDLYNKEPEEYADDYYDYNGYGVGEDKTGMLFLVDIGSRQWHITRTGECVYGISDYDVDSLSSTFLPYLSDGDYFICFQNFLNDIEYYYENLYYDDSDYYGGYEEPFYPDDFYNNDLNEYPNIGHRFAHKNLTVVFVSFLISAVVAAGIVIMMRLKMKTVGLQKNSNMYISDKGLTLTESRDIFLYSHVSKTSKPKDNPASHGGGRGVGGGTGSIHTGSSGTVHGGSGGHF